MEYAVVVVDDRLTNYISTEYREWRRARAQFYDDEFKAIETHRGVSIFDSSIVSFEPSTNKLVRTFGLIDVLLESSVVPVPPEPWFFEDDFEYVTSSHGSRYPPHIAPSFSSTTVADPEIDSVDSFIAYWNPSIVTSDENTQLDFALPDSITKWNVMVLATSADGRFGFATTSFNVNANSHQH
ncbi:MAG: hypothetical protein F4077_02240 [Gammaproteobacteria bacterium]|nr:hypothetical protein [Gammaproteobacteria bacterium]MYI76575.1 hypothetical protein [Gammaproteobacteria bacterium]